MSTEAVQTVAFLRRLRLAAPDAVIVKYNDRRTTGLPDASCTWRGRTLWLEFKVRSSGDVGTLPEVLARTNRRAQIQLHTLARYDRASEGRAFLVLFEPAHVIRLYRVLDARTWTFAELAHGTLDEMTWRLLSHCA